MANSILGNKIFIDTTGEVTDLRTKVAVVLFTTSNAGDELLLRETSGGANTFHVKGGIADQTDAYYFEVPIVFNNGIYVQTLSAGATAVLITTQGGS
jgi:hypothetical protein